MSPSAMLSIFLDAKDRLLTPSQERQSFLKVIIPRLKKGRLWKLAAFVATICLFHGFSQYMTRGRIGYELRLLALGDSITWGYGSSDFNGYRDHLLEALVGNRAAFVGSEATGDMGNNLHEGRPGGRIAATVDAAAWGLDERPNVVLLHIGSNDLIYGSDGPDAAPGRLARLLDDVFGFCPDAVVLVSKLGPSWNDFYTGRFDAFNRAIEPVVWERQDRGARVLLLNIPALLDSARDFADDLHPNDSGYRKMAAGWLAGIREAERRGWIQPPVVVGYADES